MAEFNPWWNEEKHDKNLPPYIDRSITHYESETLGSVKEYSFRVCSALESVDIPNATSIGTYAFNGCSSLTSVDLPKATSIGTDAFNGCSSLTDVNIPLVTSLNNVFTGCAFTRLILPNVDTTGDTAPLGGGVALDCTNLSVVDFHKSITMNKGVWMGMGHSPFYGDTNLYNLILRGDTLSVMTVASMLGGTPFATSGSGAKIYVPQSLVDSYKSATNWSEYAEFFTPLEGSPYEDPDWWKD